MSDNPTKNEMWAEQELGRLRLAFEDIGKTLQGKMTVPAWLHMMDVVASVGVPMPHREAQHNRD